VLIPGSNTRLFDQPQHRPIEQLPPGVTRLADPGGDEVRRLGLGVTELPIPQQRPDLRRVIVGGLPPVAVLLHRRPVLDAELFGDVPDHHLRYLDRAGVGQERAEHPHRSPLDRPAEPVLQATPGSRLRQRGLIQEEELLQLLRRRVRHEPAIPAHLLHRQPLMRHGTSP
jgi:hypothetical protein